MDSGLRSINSLATRLENLAKLQGADLGSEEGGVSAAIQGYDTFLNEHVTAFLEIAKKIGGDCEKATTYLCEALTETRKLIEIASKSKKPSDDKLGPLLQPISLKIMAAVEMRDKNRGSPHINHLQAVAESVGALGWVAVPNTPVSFCKETADSAVFYTNRVLKDFKDKEQIHVDWAKGLPNMYKELVAYIKTYHMTGLTWNPKGGDVSEASGSSAAQTTAKKVETPEEQIATLTARLEQITAFFESKFGGSGDEDGEPASIGAFKEFLATHAEPFFALSKKIGGDVATCVAFFETGLKETLVLIEKATKTKKPSDDKLGPVLQPISMAIQGATEFRDKNRGSKDINHLHAIAESIGAFGWVCVPNTPVTHCKETADSATFYTNRILKDNKDKDEDRVAWAKGLPALFKELTAYIKTHHMTGLTWNPKGESL
eukprot:GCRY01000742.1.p1 GENE.GCRY01000742.1~~GCRY01000742.1.p1  ORF type:complete len:459 (-),score=109.80 GCRY01000742.1:17-1312(-)